MKQHPRVASCCCTLRVIGMIVTHISISVEQLPMTSINDQLRHSHACQGSTFEISCASDEILAFETARYGRGSDRAVSELCRVPFSATCDVDVRFSLNRACAGRRHCSFPVSKMTFGGRCGYDEFLAVTYRCIQVFSIFDVCSSTSAITRRHRQLTAPERYRLPRDVPRDAVSRDSAVYYLSTPYYPARYPADSNCTWSVAGCGSTDFRYVVNVTTVDIEMNVRRAGKCHDVIEISGRTMLTSPSQLAAADDDVNGSRRQSIHGFDGEYDVNRVRQSGSRDVAFFSTNRTVFFAECGAVGKQTISINSCDVTVAFRTGRSAIGQRGFLLRVEVTKVAKDDVKIPVMTTMSTTTTTAGSTITDDMTSLTTWPVTEISAAYQAIAAVVFLISFIITSFLCARSLRRQYQRERTRKGKFTCMKRIHRQLPPDVVGACTYSDESPYDVRPGVTYSAALVCSAMTSQRRDANECLSDFDDCVDCDVTIRSAGTERCVDADEHIRWSAPLPVPVHLSSSYCRRNDHEVFSLSNGCHCQIIGSQRNASAIDSI